MNHKIKALFLDLDGTLLDDEKQIPPANSEALEEALAAGHKVAIATGRPLESALLQAEKLGLAGEGCFLIAYNGGILYDCGNKKVLYSRTIPLEIVAEVFAEADRRGQFIQTYRNGKVLVEQHNEGYNVREYCRFTRMEYDTVGSIRELESEPCKLLASDFENTAPLEAFRDWVVTAYRGVLDSFLSSRTLLEIVPAGLNKGRAILQLAEIMGIPKEDTIAVGDEINDLPMIRSAGCGVCMANGVPEVKAEADYITEADNNSGGVAEVIRKMLL